MGGHNARDVLLAADNRKQSNALVRGRAGGRSGGISVSAAGARGSANSGST